MIIFHSANNIVKLSLDFNGKIYYHEMYFYKKGRNRTSIIGTVSVQSPGAFFRHPRSIGENAMKLYKGAVEREAICQLLLNGKTS